MSQPVTVVIVASPVACATGVTDSWRQAADWVAGQLAGRFGEDVQVRYYDLFDADCPSLPADAQLPLVMVDGELFSAGTKISAPAIRRRIESLLGEDSGV